MAARKSVDFSTLTKVNFIRGDRNAIVCLVGVLLIAAFLASCGGSGGSKTSPPPPVPAIQNINSSTTPSSPVGLPIELNGSGFQSAPGQVVFTQGSITATVTPSASGWTD